MTTNSKPANHKWWHFLFTNLVCIERGDKYGYTEVHNCHVCDEYFKTYVQVRSDDFIEYDKKQHAAE